MITAQSIRNTKIFSLIIPQKSSEHQSISISISISISTSISISISISISNLGGEQRVPSTRALPGSLAGKHFQSSGALLSWLNHHFTRAGRSVLKMVPIESKYILKDSRGSIKEELPCAQRIEVTEGQDIRWNRIIRKKWSYERIFEIHFQSLIIRILEDGVGYMYLVR